MPRRTGVITTNGRVTIPASIRSALGLRAGDRVQFTVEDGKLYISHGETFIEWSRGIVETHEPPSTAEQLREAGEIAIVEGIESG